MFATTRWKPRPSLPFSTPKYRQPSPTGKHRSTIGQRSKSFRQGEWPLILLESQFHSHPGSCCARNRSGHLGSNRQRPASRYGRPRRGGWRLAFGRHSSSPDRGVDPYRSAPGSGRTVVGAGVSAWLQDLPDPVFAFRRPDRCHRRIASSAAQGDRRVSVCTPHHPVSGRELRRTLSLG